MNMALSKQIPVLNAFILLIICNANSTMQNSNFLFGHASVEKLVKGLSYDVTLDLTVKDILVVTSTNLIIIEKPVRKIDFNINGLKIREYIFHLFRLPYMDYYNFKNHYLNDTELTFNFDSAVPSGFYNMTIEFSRDIFENEIEVYKTSHKDYNGKARWIFKMQLGLNGFLPTFSHWHEPTSRARFAISLKQSWYCTVFSNMEIRSQWIANNSMIHTEFNPTPSVPAHVLAISLTNFDCLTKTINFYTLRVCSTSLAKWQITFALKISEAIMLHMTLYTGILLQFPEITHIGLPNYSYEDMENWGSNYYRKDHLMYNESLHLIDRKLDVSMFVARGTALQWFNHLFNPMLWTHVWFCQTLALFYGAKAFAKVYGDEDISDLFTYRLRTLAREEETVWQVGSLMSAMYGNNPENFDKLNIFDNKYIFQISLKAYAGMVMLENAITEPVFQNTVISYLEKHQFSTASPNGFWDAIENENLYILNGLPPVAQLVQSWLKLKSFPVVTVTSNVNVVIRLEDVYAEENNNNTNDLWLPMKYVASRIKTDIIWMGTEWLTKKEKIIFLSHNPDEWIVVNWQDSGYYRVKYDLPLLESLAAYMSKNHANIDVLSRAQIIEDAYYFWTKDELNIQSFANLISFMSNEEQCAPWYAIQNIIQKMETCFSFDINKCGIKYQLLLSVLMELLNQLIEKVGYTEHSDDMECVKFKRILATKWLCQFNKWQCVDNAEKILMEHLKDPERHVILPMWEKWTYCNGLKQADEFTWNGVLAEYVLTANKKILTYLTCSQRIDIILKYLDLVTSKTLSILDSHGLNVEDRRKIYRSIVRKHISNHEVMNHISWKIDKKEITDMFYHEILNDIKEKWNLWKKQV